MSYAFARLLQPLHETTPEEARQLVSEAVTKLWEAAGAETGQPVPKPVYQGTENPKAWDIPGRPVYDITSTNGTVRRVYGDYNRLDKKIFFVAMDGRTPIEATEIFGIKAAAPTPV